MSYSNFMFLFNSHSASYSIFCFCISLNLSYFSLAYPHLFCFSLMSLLITRFPALPITDTRYTYRWPHYHLRIDKQLRKKNIARNSWMTSLYMFISWLYLLSRLHQILLPCLSLFIIFHLFRFVFLLYPLAFLSHHHYLIGYA